MLLPSRTSRSLGVTAVLLLVVWITGVLVDAADSDDRRTRTDAEERQRRGSSHRQHEHRQQITDDCSVVHQFARQTMQYSNPLPPSKSHGTFSDGLCRWCSGRGSHVRYLSRSVHGHVQFGRLPVVFGTKTSSVPMRFLFALSSSTVMQRG